MEERIKRINELYHKSKKEGLTEEEKAQQALLRREYIDSVKANLKVQLDNIVVENPDGTIQKPGKKGRTRDENEKKGENPQTDT